MALAENDRALFYKGFIYFTLMMYVYACIWVCVYLSTLLVHTHTHTNSLSLLATTTGTPVIVDLF